MSESNPFTTAGLRELGKRESPSWTAALESKNPTKPKAPETLGVTGEVFTQPAMRPTGRARSNRAPVDASLLLRATELLDDIESLRGDDLALTVEALRCVTCELWKSVATTTQFHQSILAIIESFLLSHESFDYGQGAALRGAIKDLGLPLLNEQHVEVIRSQFIDHGHRPLAALSDYNASDEQTD